MLDEATTEARRLAASLRSIDADLAESAKAVSLALAGHSSHKALMGVAATLEVIEGQLPSRLHGVEFLEHEGLSWMKKASVWSAKLSLRRCG